MKIDQYGSSNGIPVVFFFGTPQRGDAGAELDGLASRHGIRLICPTRPWYDSQTTELSFDAVTRPVLEHLTKSRIDSAFAAGASGGGPFALHLTIAGMQVIRDCTLLASMGLPEIFAEQVTSPPTIELLKSFDKRDYEGWHAACAGWGLPRDLAHGAWGDFSVFFDDLPGMERKVSQPVHVYQSESDPNAPLKSVQEMLSDASNVEWHIDESADHIAMARGTEDTVFTRIFKSIRERASMV